MKTILTTLSDHCATALQLLRLPRAHLHFDQSIAPAHVRATWRYFTKPHPTYKLIQNKSWGAALIDLHRYPGREAYFDSIKGKHGAAGQARRARAHGYRLVTIERNDHIEAIHAINTSTGARQGRPMDQKYLQKQLHFEALDNFRYYGVLDPDGQLMAYANVGHYGNFHAFDQLIGYRNNHGIMHMMVVDIVATLIDQGLAHYVMYDTYFGALPGMRQFKLMLGFAPYRAIYHLK
ncbi:hypothetical protein [Massilia antarctica]|uniref:hypothetical protein n=1 Tax=Massilia antarctica TaxID=2765360 RepID=UPI0006BB7A55|nr:hypothetical protein [Massilia sp. H27-R4]MCY0910723.1 hypothetical protein [Massilia sp. H27-R4]CUI08901.1 hypothetical protein BN2497_12579 [Janthinobacterium sp. CG23_2]CUU32687.1 hypothetical protein BN3177_12579 [Janthinobacterium sp. CG23_2]